MGIDISIGVARDKNRVRNEELSNAPAIEGSWMKPHVNTFGMTISGWHEAIRRIGIFNLVNDCDDFGCWEPGMYQLTETDGEYVAQARDRCTKKHTGVKPRFKNSQEESDLAIMFWLAWWIRWALQQEMPAYIQVSY